VVHSIAHALYPDLCILHHWDVSKIGAQHLFVLLVLLANSSQLVVVLVQTVSPPAAATPSLIHRQRAHVISDLLAMDMRCLVQVAQP